MSQQEIGLFSNVRSSYLSNSEENAVGLKRRLVHTRSELTSALERERRTESEFCRVGYVAVYGKLADKCY